MAESENNLEQVEITCANCHECCSESNVLPCDHYYCKKCVLKLALETTSDQPLSCPECHQEVKCEDCIDAGDKAEAFCHQCDMFICKECVKSHKRMKSYASHEVVSLNIEDSTPSKCLTHEKPLILYCYDCSVLICQHCTTKTHRDHNFEYCKVSAPETKEQIQSKTKALRELSCILSHSVEDIQTTKQEIETQGKSVADTINTSFNQFQLILNNRKEDLLRENTKKVEAKINNLSKQENNLSRVIEEVRNIIEHAEKFVRYSSDNKVMNLHAEIEGRIEHGVEEHSMSGRSLEPVEEADMGIEVRCGEALQQLCQTKAKVTQLAIDPAQCTLRGEGAQTAEVNQTAKVIVIANTLTNNKTTRRRAVIVSELKSLYNGSVVKCEVEQSKPGEYRIQYTPTVRGRHKLTVFIDGQQVAGSPFAVSVSISPTLLGKPVKVWTGIETPRGITVNSVNEVIVCTESGILMKLNKNGQYTVLVNEQSHMWTALATDTEDNIFCVSYSANILRYDKQANNYQIKEIIPKINGPGCCGVAVAGEEVMVTEFYNTGTIVVYNRNLEYVRHIKHSDMGEFQRITLYKQNIYVTDYKRAESCIRVFNHDGHLLHSFQGGKKLKNPCGLSVSGQFVYVTDYSYNNVVVFTTDGDHVVTFGRKGVNKGEFKAPTDICINKDNFIYVCEFSGYRIQCF